MAMHSGTPIYTHLAVPASLYFRQDACVSAPEGDSVRRGRARFPHLFLYLAPEDWAAAIPVVITPDGEWLQDSSVIIDELEKRFPEKPALPETPVLHFAAYLFELWGDEFWLPLAMHGRWSHAENLPFYAAEIGSNLLASAPPLVSTLCGQPIRQVDDQPEQEGRRVESAIRAD